MFQAGYIILNSPSVTNGTAKKPKFLTETEPVEETTPCSTLIVNRGFGGTYRLNLQGRRITRVRNPPESKWQTLLGRGLHFTGGAEKKLG
jgi:hypothetical protein